MTKPIKQTGYGEAYQVVIKAVAKTIDQEVDWVERYTTPWWFKQQWS